MLKTILAFVVIAAASSVAAFDPFANPGAPPTIMGAWVGRSYSPDVTSASGGVVTDDGSFLFKNKVGGFASGKYSSWEFKENSERAYFAIYSHTLVLPDGAVLEQELCEYGYVFGIVWQASESATTCPPAQGDDSMGGRYVRVPLALSEAQLTALGEGAGQEGNSGEDGGIHIMAPRITA